MWTKKKERKKQCTKIIRGKNCALKKICEKKQCKKKIREKKSAQN